MRNPSVEEPAPAAQDEPTVIEPAAADPVVAEPVVAEPVAEPDPGTATEVQPTPAADDATTPPSAPTPAPAAAATTPPKKKSPFGFLKELPALLLVAFVLALIIKTFLVQAFYIPSGSMENTLLIGDRVLVNKVTYHFHDPRRGDIIVFAEPHPPPGLHRSLPSAFWHWLTEGLGVSNSPDKDFIKRVIGLPGDTVEVSQGIVFINGHRLNEPGYLNPVKDRSDFPPTKVPAGNLFVMGDNRTGSNDSRGTLGFIPLNKVIGRAFVIIWPPSRFHWLSGIHYPVTMPTPLKSRA
jgi:signal peptidase I